MGADDYVPLFANMQFVMLTAVFVALILSYDLKQSINTMPSNRRTKLYFIFGLLLFFYVSEFFLTMGTVISALCPAALWSLGVCHYSIKVIVSYMYCTRITIAMKGSMRFSGSTTEKVLNGLQAIIILVALMNLMKVFMFYKSFRDGDVCVYDLGGFWMYTDEIMFGSIDLFTLGVLTWFYFHASTVSGDTAKVIERILYMSGITMFATLFAIFVNLYDAPIGLAASIMDISTDIITLMKVFTSPKKKSSISNSKAGSVSRTNPGSFSRASHLGGSRQNLMIGEKIDHPMRKSSIRAAGPAPEIQLAVAEIAVATDLGTDHGGDE